MSLDEVQDVPAQDSAVPKNTPAAASDGSEAADAPASRGGWAAVRPLLLRLHFYAGLLIAPLLFVAAATGLMYALSWQAEKVVYADELTVARVGDVTVPLS